MRDEVRAPLPRPGKTVKAGLALLFAVSVASAIVVNWAPGGAEGQRWFLLLAAVPEAVAAGQVWRLVTAGVLTAPSSLGHVLFSMAGLYFLTPDLERRWGSARLARFLVLASVLGVSLGVGVALALPGAPALFHPPFIFGPGTALTAVAIAWSRENAGLQVRLFFVLPVSGRALQWVTVGFCVLGVVYHEGIPEGVVAPFGGLFAGWAFGGSPSPLRLAWLKTRLALLRRRSGGLRAEDVIQGSRAPRPPRGSAPALRVLRGGVAGDDPPDDAPGKRKPPKDKRFLN